MSLLKVTPLEKKSISYNVLMCRENDDGTISTFTVDDGYRWGQGWLDEEEDSIPYKEDNTVHCSPSTGWGSDLDDQCSCWFEFSDDISEEEQEHIKKCYLEGDEDNRCGMGWLFEGDHKWQVEEDYIEILGPYRVDRCDSDGNVIEENIELKPRPDPSTVWPFSPK